jgi:toxin ParE1/3/4
MRVAWEERAVDDLETIVRRIGRDSPQAAKKVLPYLVGAAEMLAASPRMGRSTGRGDLRELVLTRFPYVLFYEIVADEVRILGVFHHRQRR